MSLTGVINTHLMVAELVRRYGTDDQRAHFLPRLAAAELRGGLALTEPDCGTDLQAVRTTATRADGVYVLRGTKMWITNAHEGSCLAVLVKTDVDVEPRHRGMSLFIVPKDLGYTVPRKLGKLGYKGVDTCEVVFDDVVVPDDHLLGGVEGRGFHQAVGALELGRINIAARGVGVADAALGGVAAVRAATPHDGQADRRAPGDRDEARRHGVSGRVGAVARAAGRRRVRPRRALRPRGGDGEAGGVGGRARERDRGDAHPRCLRLLHRRSRRALLPRRPAAVHR